MPIEFESRYLVAAKTAQLALLWPGLKTKANNITALYIPPEKIMVQFKPDHELKKVVEVSIGYEKIPVPDAEQAEFYEIFEQKLVDKHGVLKPRHDINVRLRSAQKDGSEKVKYRFAIKADPPGEKLDKLFESLPDKKRELIENSAKIKEEWQFDIEPALGQKLMAFFIKYADVSWLMKRRYKMVESGAWILEEAVANSQDVKFGGLWVSEYESASDFGVPDLRQPWLGDSPLIKTMGSYSLASASQAEFAAMLAKIKKDGQYLA